MHRIREIWGGVKDFQWKEYPVKKNEKITENWVEWARHNSCPFHSNKKETFYPKRGLGNFKFWLLLNQTKKFKLIFWKRFLTQKLSDFSKKL